MRCTSSYSRSHCFCFSSLFLAISEQLPINRIFSFFSKPFRTKSPHHRSVVHVYSFPTRIVNVRYTAIPQKFLRRDQQSRTEIRTKKRNERKKSRKQCFVFNFMAILLVFFNKNISHCTWDLAHLLTLTLEEEWEMERLEIVWKRKKEEQAGSWAHTSKWKV